MIRLLLVLLCLTLSFANAYAQENNKIDVDEWSTLPIVHEGRIKPIDSFSRIILKKISGRETIKNLSASEWLAEAIFNPSQSMERPIFKVNQPQVLSLKKRKNKYYSYTEIALAINENKKAISTLLETNENEWIPEQREMMRVFQNYILMTQTLRSLTAILPLSFAIPKQLEPNNDEISNYLALKKREEVITTQTQKTVKRKGTNLEKYSNEEIAIADLSFQLRTIENGGKNNILFKIYEDKITSKITNWASPWEIILNGRGSPKSAEFMAYWQRLATSYQQENHTEFKTATTKLLTQQKEITKSLKIEKAYNAIPLKNMALGIYFIIFSFISFAYIRNKNLNKRAKIIISLFGFATILHLTHILLRISILNRPPVGTLYESVVFVSLVCAIIMLLITIRQTNDKRISSIFIGSISAFTLLFISNGLVNENSMTTLTAVLNTNFWLTVHVLCITIGYGFCILASTMAHIYLFKNIRNKTDNVTLSSMFKSIRTIAVFALLFTAIGTILGGIWADQSWGRFWGWDPKENGALLIVLWLVWLLHSRVSGHLKTLGFITGMAFMNIIVVLAWFGVNLLNVGLHSYGFIEGIAISIGLFCFIEISIITTLTLKSKQTKKI